MPPSGSSFRVELVYPSDKEALVLKTRSLAKQIGFCEKDQFLVATVASELGTNIIRYAKCGEIEVREIQSEKHSGLEIIATDRGPGIPDIGVALREGYSTSKGSLGMGLSVVRRLTDGFQIESEPGKGTRICVQIWVKDAANRHALGQARSERTGR